MVKPPLIEAGLQCRLGMARAIVVKIDPAPQRRGMERARAVCQRWFHERPRAAVGEWLKLLELRWEEIRQLLLDESERGQRLRQSDPFCGILSPQERWEIYRNYLKAN